MNRKSFGGLVAVVVLSFCGCLPARAEEWVRIIDGTAAAYDIDVSSLDVKQEVVQAWVRESLPKPVRDGGTQKDYSVELSREAEDCQRRQMAPGAYVRRDKGGLVVAQGVRAQSWADIVPGSVGETIWKAACTAAHPPIDKPILDSTPGTGWQSLGEDNAGAYRLFMKMDEVVEIRPGFVAAIGRSDFKLPQRADGYPYFFEVTGYVIDCVNTKLAIAAVDDYLTASLRMRSYRADFANLEFLPAAPATFLGRYVKDICGAAKPENSGRATVSSGDVFSGTAWGVDKGYLVTASHVIKDAGTIKVFSDGREIGKATVVADDPANDLAILSFSPSSPGKLKILSLAARPAILGKSVFTLGYPAPDVMGQRIKMTAGEVSGTAGIRDDARYLQISVPIQSGNSGGPVIGWDGAVVGIVEATLKRLDNNEDSARPQNVNYAIKAAYLRPLLEDLPDLANYEPVKVSADQGLFVAAAQSGCLYAAGDQVTLPLDFARHKP